MAIFVQIINGNGFPCTGSPCGSYYLTGWGQSVGQPYSIKRQQRCWDSVTTTTSVCVRGRALHLTVADAGGGANVMVTFKKRVKDTYVNYTVSEKEVLDA